ncbi:MAG: aminoacetone oxidase family FAD-binding enzyme [Clostridia bacterium]|nr:aminoacetone oxidase family FAD-binding enzyme [Clostridia bacterium]
MNKLFKVAVLGGGASGLLSAVELLSGDNALSGKDVVILERTDRVGKKLVATGNGQGNLSNVKISIDNYSGSQSFILSFIENFKRIKPVLYLKNLGIITEADETGRIYPVSRQANSVLDIIRQYLLSKNCNVITDFKAVGVKADSIGFNIISERGEMLTAEKVVLAVGGKAAKQFGTDGTSYALATAFGHKLTSLYPSLVQLKTEKESIKGLKGIKHNVALTLTDGEKPVKTATGDLLFTDFGVSGNVVFKVSDKVQILEDPTLNIDFVPSISEAVLVNILKRRKEQGFIPQKELLNGIVHKKLGEKIFALCGNDVIKTAKAIKCFKLKVVGTLGFDYAQTTKGGIKTDDINPETFESKLQKGLYIVGEMLDVDGECGGYNLTFAFTSGIAAAKAVKTALK